MARYNTLGFETGSILSEGWATTGTVTINAGTPTIETTTVRTGTYSCKFDATGGASQQLRIRGAGVSAQASYCRFYVNFASFTAVAGYTAVIYSKPAAYRIVCNNSGQLALQRVTAGTNVGSPSSALSTDVWYRIEIMTNMNDAAGNDDSAELRINGVTIASVTNENASTTGSGTNNDIGLNVSGAAGSRGICYIDDIAITTGDGVGETSWPGEGRVKVLKPISDSAVGTSWEGPQTTGSDTTNLYDNVNNVPPVGVAHSDVDANAGKYVFHAVASQTDFDVNMESYTTAGIDSNDTIKVVFGQARIGSSSTTNTAAAIDLVSNPDQGTETAITTFDVMGVTAATEPTGWGNVLGTYNQSPSVTLGTSPVLRVGKRVANARVGMVSQMLITVEYQPTILVTLTQPSETDEAQPITVKINRLVSVAQIEETDFAQVITPEQTGGAIQVTVNQVTETDTSQAVTHLKIKTVAQNTELDTAQTHTARKTKALLQNTETDTTQTLDANPYRRLISQATETDLSQTHTHLKTKALGQNTETDLAQSITAVVSKIVAVGQATETDTAQTHTHSKTKTLGQNSETDTSQAIDVNPYRRLLGQNSETDSAQPITVKRTYTFGLNTESDEAQAITKIDPFLIQVAQNSETDLAQPITSHKRKATGQNSETDLAQAITIVDIQLIPVAQTSETDTAQAIEHDKTKTVAQTSELEIAQPITSKRTYTLGRASETDTAQNVDYARGALLTQPGETDTAQSITARKTKAIGQTTEIDEAQVVALQGRLGICFETDTAQPITHAKVKAIGQASETDFAQQVKFAYIIPINQATETDSAQAVTHRKTKATVQAVESDIAQSVTHRKVKALLQASETDTAQPVTGRESFAVIQTGETNTARPITKTKIKAIGQVFEVDEAGIAINNPPVYVPVNQAVETDTAEAMTYTSFRIVNQVEETDTVSPLSISKVKLISQLQETDSAGNVFFAVNITFGSSGFTAKPNRPTHSNRGDETSYGNKPESLISSKGERKLEYSSKR